MEAAAPAQRRRWPVYLAGALVLLVILLWLGYWFAASTLAAKAIDRVTSAPIAGQTISCPDRALAGFPLRIDLRCQRLTISSAGEGLAASLGGFWASAPLYLPGRVDATLDAPLQVDMPARGLALTASWSAASASGSVWLDGLSGGSAHFQGLTVANAGRPDALPLTNLNAATADAGIAAAGGGSYRINATADHVTFKRPDGSGFPELSTKATVVAENVGPLGTDPTAALLKWARAGGPLKIEDLQFSAVGAIITANGTLSLSKDGLLNGSLLLSYNNIDALADLIETLRPGSRQKYSSAYQMLNVFTRATKTPAGDFRQTSLTFQDGAIWLAIVPLPIDPIPPIKF